MVSNNTCFKRFPVRPGMSNWIGALRNRLDHYVRLNHVSVCRMLQHAKCILQGTRAHIHISCNLGTHPYLVQLRYIFICCAPQAHIHILSNSTHIYICRATQAHIHFGCNSGTYSYLVQHRHTSILRATLRHIFIFAQVRHTSILCGTQTHNHILCTSVTNPYCLPLMPIFIFCATRTLNPYCLQLTFPPLTG